MPKDTAELAFVGLSSSAATVSTVVRLSGVKPTALLSECVIQPSRTGGAVRTG